MNVKSFLKLISPINIIIIISFSWMNLNKLSHIMDFFFFVILFLYILVYYREKINICRILKNSWILIFISVYIFLTTIYSENFSLTWNYAINHFSITIYTIIIASLYSKEEFYRIIKKYLLITILASYILIMFLPSKGNMYYQGEYVAKGVFGHKNVLARTMVISVIIFSNEMLVGKNKIKKFAYAVLSVLSVYLILLAKSTSGIIYASAFLFIGYLLYKKNLTISLYIKFVYTFLIIFNIMVYVLSRPYLSDILDKIVFFGKNLTFTGRNVIWYYSIDKALNHFILGYGVNSFWNSKYLSQFYLSYGFSPPHAHNGYINLLLDGGIILLVLILILSIRGINSNINNNLIYSRINILIITFILIINLTESSFTEIFWLLLCYAYLSGNSTKFTNLAIRDSGKGENL